MNIFTASLLLVLGLVVLWKSADVLVTGAVSAANRFGISTFIIGLTIVAMGTSAPEVAASITAAVRGMGDIAVANVYGSNIANLALVGGIVAIIRPIRISRTVLRREIPVMLGAGLLLWPILINLYLSMIEGVILLTVFGLLILLTIRTAKNQATLETVDNEEIKARRLDIKVSILFIVIGLVGLVLGAELTIRGAVFIGRHIGLSNAVIGLSIVAIGTSLPELVTCVVAALKGHNDISVGNLVGSNIFNTLLVTGVAGIVSPFAIVARLAGTDFWLMIAVSVLFIFMAARGGRISRLGGVVLLCSYIGFLVYLASSI